ncbi:unnamed protein product [Enterobius vermicularis]|uniref:LITAF domain-containing protein n=1 Tax=Enterobius vermicularis TaxID=51028 RepID=A0A0N4VF88_ENTVE|nr:unnamed protein product [Enterobius vermicularis]
MASTEKSVVNKGYFEDDQTHLDYRTEVKMVTLERSKSVPIPIHRSASHTPSMMVNAKKFLSDRPQLLDCPRCKV